MRVLVHPVQTHSEIVQVHSLLQSSEETKQFAWFNWTFTGGKCGSQTPILPPKGSVLSLHYILH